MKTLILRFSVCLQRLVAVMPGLLLAVLVLVVTPEARAQHGQAVLFAYDATGVRIVRIVRPDSEAHSKRRQLRAAIENKRSSNSALAGQPSIFWYDKNGSLLLAEPIFDPRITRVPASQQSRSLGENIIYREQGVFMLHGPADADSVVLSLYDNRTPVKTARAGSFGNNEEPGLAEPLGKEMSSQRSAQVWTFSLHP